MTTAKTNRGYDAIKRVVNIPARTGLKGVSGVATMIKMIISEHDQKLKTIAIIQLLNNIVQQLSQIIAISIAHLG